MCTRYIPPEQADIEYTWHIGRRTPQRWPAELYPRSPGPFLRRSGDAASPGLELVVGRWGLIPPSAKSPDFAYATHNARYEGIAGKPSFKRAWLDGQRCLIPAWSFDEPCWETGRNVWWRFRRADGTPWALAGLWNTWTDRASGEVVESYTMLTINADNHALISRMHKPDPKLPPDKQDKRSVAPIEPADIDRWLTGSPEDAASLLRVPPVDLFDAAPVS